MLEVKCPSCHHIMKYQPKEGTITEKVKRCVYCGRSFKIHASLNESRVHKILPAF